jgi:EmrB/QacA subfamily drug resistance transporter
MVLIATSIGSFATAANLSTVNVAFPDIRASFPDASLSSIGWVITAYTIAFAAVLLPAGRWADCHGRRRVFFIGLAMFGAGSLLCGLAPTLSAVIVGRAVQGCGAALIVPASLGLLLEASAPEERTRAVALYGGITAIGVATGPTLGALIVDSAGWRVSFLLSPPFALVAWLLGRRTLSASRGVGAARVDAIGVVSGTVAMALLSLAIAEGRTWGWSSTRTAVALLGAVLASALFVRQCRTHPSPVLPLALFRVRSFSLSVGATVLFGAATGAVLLANVLFLTGVWHYSILRAGLAMAPSPIVAALCAPIVGRAGSRYGERALAVPGALVLASATSWYRWRVDATPDYFEEWFVGAVLSGIGINTAFPMLQSAGVRDVGAVRYSVANAATRASLQLGTAIGVAVLVAILGEDAAGLAQFQVAWHVIAPLAKGVGVHPLGKPAPPALGGARRLRRARVEVAARPLSEPDLRTGGEAAR